MCYILWIFSTSKKPINILSLKPWTEFDFTPLNRCLRPQLSFISEETLILSPVTLPSPLEMLSNPVNLPCGTKCWREFHIFWSGYFAFVLFIIVVIDCHHHYQHYHYHYHCHCHHHYYSIAETDWCCCKRLIFLAGDLFLRLSGSRVQL